MVLFTSLSYEEKKRYVPKRTINEFEQNSAANNAKWRYVPATKRGHASEENAWPESAMPVKKRYIASSLKKELEKGGPVACSSKRKFEQTSEDEMAKENKIARMEKMDNTKDAAEIYSSFLFDDQEDKRIEGLLCYVDALIEEIHALLRQNKSTLSSNSSRFGINLSGQRKLDGMESLGETQRRKHARMKNTCFDVIYTCKKKFPGFIISDEEMRRIDTELHTLDSMAENNTVITPGKCSFPFPKSELRALDELLEELDAEIQTLDNISKDTTDTKSKSCGFRSSPFETKTVDMVLEEIDKTLEELQTPDEQAQQLMIKKPEEQIMLKEEKKLAKCKPVTEKSTIALKIPKDKSRTLKTENRSDNEQENKAKTNDSVTSKPKKRKFIFIPVSFP